MIHKMIAGTVAGMLLVLPVVAFSMEPMAVIKGPIDTVVEILNDPKFKDAGTKSAQRDEIWKIVKPMFDFKEISRRAVAQNWPDFEDGEKAGFTDVFSEFLGNTYIDKIQGEYHNEKVVYLEQNIIKNRFAEVKTQILRENTKLAVDYRLFKNTDGQWKVYDIIVEGVSLVKNYRVQFANILKKEKPSDLIQLLTEKLAQQRKQFAESG